jgi:hypothetical protein
MRGRGQVGVFEVGDEGGGGAGPVKVRLDQV